MKKNNFKGRHVARLVIVESLYIKNFDESYDINKTSRNVIGLLPIMLGQLPAQNIELEFIDKILDGVSANLTNIDSYIERSINKEIALQKLDLIVLSIIRAAIYEMAFLEEIPTRVIIDEYVSITSSVCFKKEAGFVNGILDKIASLIRPENI
jgi:transcription antitermination protein NusB